MNWAFSFTQLPKPAGEPGGGMANASWARFVLLGQARRARRLPIGVLGGGVLSDTARPRLKLVDSFRGGRSNCVPLPSPGASSFVDCWSCHILPGFPRLGGAWCWGHDDDSAR